MLHSQEDLRISSLNYDFDDYPKIFPVEKLFSDYAQTYINNPDNPSNCFFSSLAAISNSETNPRFMDHDEFESRLVAGFKKRDNGIPLPGDILVFRGRSGSAIHAANYVGKLDDQTDMVLTKNGKTKGELMFMDLEALNRLYPDTTLETYTFLIEDQ